MGTMASQITNLTSVYSTVYSGVCQRKHQSSASLAFVRGLHRWPVNSPHKWPVTRKMFPFDDVIMDIFKRSHIQNVHSYYLRPIHLYHNIFGLTVLFSGHPRHTLSTWIKNNLFAAFPEICNTIRPHIHLHFTPMVSGYGILPNTLQCQHNYINYQVPVWHRWKTWHVCTVTLCPQV